MVSIKVLATLLSTTTALSLPLVERAGGPIAKPIPSNCAVVNVTPSPETTSFALTPDFLGANLIYSYYLPEPSDLASFDEPAKIKQCVEQCNGLGTGCTGVLWAHNVDHVSYGVENTGIACLFSHVKIEQSSLETVNNGSYTGAQALNIVCPA